MNLCQLEDLFVEKLTEKYRLTQRDIKRAFAKFDKDNSGYLSLHELSNAIHLFLNGVDKKLVQELVKRYDVDGDGSISLDEFSSFLLSRTDEDQSNWMRVDHLAAESETPYSSRPSSHQSKRRVAYDNDSTDNASDNIQYQTKIFLQHLKGFLTKQTLDRRGAGKISITDRREFKTSDLIKTEASNYIRQLFATYIPPDDTSRSVPLGSFKRVLKRISIPGMKPVADSVLDYLAEACADSNRADNSRASPQALLDILFDEEKTVQNKFGFTKTVPAAGDTSRPTVGVGPLRTPRASDMPEVNKMNRTPHKLSEVAYRFVTKKSRSALAVPSNFNMRLVDRSAHAPRYDCLREHVYGLNASSLISPCECIHTYPSHTEVYGDDEEVYLESPDGDKVIYSSASLGIVHNLVTGEQSFFEGHDDDISCISLSPGDLGLVATGQVGKSPVVCVWDPSCLVPSASANDIENEDNLGFSHSYEVQEGGIVGEYGRGFFHRSVCAVAISYDGQYLCGIGCDDHHAMGIWDISSGELVAEAACHNGTPPQVHGLVWSPFPMQGTFINKDMRGECDILCSIGVRHLKFWAFRRPTNGRHDPTPLLSRPHRMGKVSLDLKPKEFTCAQFVPRSQSSSECDVVVGGSNGFVFVFRGGTCISCLEAFPKGRTRCMRAAPSDHHLFVGGSMGTIAVVCSRTWKILHIYSCLPSSKKGSGEVTTDILGKPSSRPSSRQRPSSAGRIRPGGERVAAGGGVGKDARGSRKGGAKGPSSGWSGPGEKKDPDNALSSGTKASTDVVGLTLINFPGGGRSASGVLGMSSVDRIVAVTGFGKCMEMVNSGQCQGADSTASPLFSFSYGPLWAVAVPRQPKYSHLFISGGDDKWLCLWNNSTFNLEARVRSRAPLRCLDFDPSTSFIAAGMVGGHVSLFFFDKQMKAASVQGSLLRQNTGASFQLKEMDARKDCMEDISDIKFSPNGKMLAVGSHDNFIDIYQAKLAGPTHTSAPSGSLRRLKRLKGHSSYITHLDWSADNRVIQSTCGAYELLFWDVLSGKQLLSTFDSLEADTEWDTHSCVLGFNVMGIWPKGSDGTDVNAVDVSRSRGLVATGDDFGNLTIFNYPCVVEDAPRKTYGGHSSHVMNVKIVGDSSDDEDMHIVTVGGNDNAAMTWTVRHDGAH